MKRLTRPDKFDYDTDFYAWAIHQSNLIKKKRFNELDIKNLVEEIVSLGRSEKRALVSKLEVLLTHLLKKQFQPERMCTSWALSMRYSRRDIRNLMNDNPSFTSLLPRAIGEAYADAIQTAAVETGLTEDVFPIECPWTKEEILGENNEN